MRPEFKNTMLKLYDDLRDTQDSDNIRQIFDLAFQLDKKGEFWKFREIFGNEEQYLHEKNTKFL